MPASTPVIPGFGALGLDGLIAVGTSEAGLSAFSLEQYDASARGIAAAVVNDRIIVFGGEGPSGRPEATYEEVEEYDPATDIAVLTFADALENLPGSVDAQYAGQALTYRLRVGTDEVAPAAPTVVDLQGPGTPEVGFDISLVFPDASLSQSQQEIIRDAADRWEEIIVGDLPQEGLIPFVLNTLPLFSPHAQTS